MGKGPRFFGNFHKYMHIYIYIHMEAVWGVYDTTPKKALLLSGHPEWGPDVLKLPKPWHLSQTIVAIPKIETITIPHRFAMQNPYIHRILVPWTLRERQLGYVPATVYSMPWIVYHIGMLLFGVYHIFHTPYRILCTTIMYQVGILLFGVYLGATRVWKLPPRRAPRPSSWRRRGAPPHEAKMARKYPATTQSPFEGGLRPFYRSPQFTKTGILVDFGFYCGVLSI